MINVEAGRLREPAAWLMVAVASASVLVGIERLLFGGSGFGSSSFSARAAIHLGTFTSPVTVALLVGAVLLATHLGPVIERLRHLALAVTITLGLSVLFGLIALLGGVLGGATSAREKIELLLVHLPSLALVAVALLYVLPRAVPAVSTGGGARGEGFPGRLHGAQERHGGHDRPHGPGYGQGPAGEQGHFQGPGANPSREHAPFQGGPSQGAPSQGAPSQGAPSQGAPFQGAPFQGAPEGRDPRDGYGHPQGTPFQESHPQGAPFQGSHPQGAPAQGAIQGAAHPQEHLSQQGLHQQGLHQQGLHPQDRSAQETPSVPSSQASSPQIPYGRPALPPAPAHASTGGPAAESTATGLPSEGYAPSAPFGDGPSQGAHPPQGDNRPYTEDATWPGRLRTPEQQASQRPGPEPVSPLSAPLQAHDPSPYVAADVQPSSPAPYDPSSFPSVPTERQGGTDPRLPDLLSDPSYGRTDPQDSGRRADSPSYGWQEASSPGTSGRHSEPQAQGTGWAEARQPGYGQHHSGPRLPDPLSDDSFSSNPRLPDALSSDALSSGPRLPDPLSDDSFSSSPRLPGPLSSAPPSADPLSSDPVYGRTDPQHPGWATDIPLYEHRAEQGQGGSAPAGRPEEPGWDPPSYGRQEPASAGSSGWYAGSPAPAPDRSEQWPGDGSEQGRRAEPHGYPEPQGYSRPESEDRPRPDLQGFGHGSDPQGPGHRQVPYTPDLQAAPRGQENRPEQQVPDGPAGANLAPDDVSASPFEDRPSPFGEPPASPFGDRAPNPFPTPPENYGGPAAAPGAEPGYSTAPDLHYPTPDPVDLRSQQMAQAYQQAKNYQQTRGNEPPLRLPEYGTPEYGTSGYGDPFGHPQTPQVSQHPEARPAQDPHPQDRPAQDRPAQNPHSQAQPSPSQASAPQYPQRDEQRWDAVSPASPASPASEATLRFDPAAYRDDPLGAPAPPSASAPAPVPERWDSQPIDPTAIYRPEQRRGQVTDEETPDTEKVGPGQDQNISWYGSDRRER